MIVSPWVAEGAVFNDAFRHTSLIATLRQEWDLGEPLTGRDPAADRLVGVLRRFVGTFFPQLTVESKAPARD